MATPIANPAIPYSDKGVLKTLSVPYFSLRPIVALKTPPNLISSPNMIALSSVFKAISNVSQIVAQRFYLLVFSGFFSLSSSTFNFSLKSKASISY